MTDTPPTKPPSTDIPPHRRSLVRLDPNLTDSPLRRALRDAALQAPFGLADDNTNDDQTEPETPTP